MMSTDRRPNVTVPQLTLYKLGLGFIGLVVFTIVVATIVQAGHARDDQQAYKQANKMADKLNGWVDKEQDIPNSLAAAGIQNTTSAITYQKLSTQRYKFCINYRSANSGGFSQTIFSSLYGSRYENGMTDPSYEDVGLYLSPYYHKGLNCQTVKPSFADSSNSSSSSSTTPAAQPFTKNADGSYTVCGVNTNYYDGEGHVTQGPPATPGSISISSDAYPYVGSRLLFIFSAGSKEFDEKCNPLIPADLTVGSTVAAFSITSPNTSATTVFLKRSF
jgi:hypothetical protein